MSLAVIVLTRDEERHIHDCLASVTGLGDELLVLDSGSLDRTVEIVREMGARIEARPFDNFARQRNAAMEMVACDWIFFVDADERATPELAAEIQERTTRADRSIPGYWVPRRNVIFGKEIRHTGWSPDYQPRILRKGRAHFDTERIVHELLLWDGEPGYLTEPLIHYNYETVGQFRQKQIRYTRAEAEIWLAEGKQAHTRGFFGQPLREFLRRFIRLQGWRDGWHGFVLSTLMAYYALVRQRMLWQMERKKK